MFGFSLVAAYTAGQIHQHRKDSRAFEAVAKTIAEAVVFSMEKIPAEYHESFAEEIQVELFRTQMKQEGI